MKFSIIVPVYNVSLYIEKCLESLKAQNGNDFEVLVINDGSTDDSLEKISSRVSDDERFHIYTKENGDISDARNYGIERATGEYLLFVDGDDFVHSNYLEVLRNALQDHPDVDILRFQVFRHLYEENRDIPCPGKTFFTSGNQAFRLLVQETYFDVVWAYLFKRSFFEKYHFRFSKGRRHEDFGLIPYVILKAKKIYAISDFLYHYVCRQESITTSKNLEKIKKRIEDSLYLYDFLKKKIEADSEILEADKLFAYSYLANAMLGLGKTLPKEELKDYIASLRERKLFDDLRRENFLQKLKYSFCRRFPKYYILHFAK